jgi:hypothetical protein
VKILALDPSSTRTGYAILTSPTADGLVEAGYLRPERSTDRYLDRITAMAQDLHGLISMTAGIDLVVIEMPSGRCGGGQRRGAGSSLIVYGVAAGMLWGVAVGRVGTGVKAVETVFENVWTGRVSKGVRQQRIAAQFPSYAKACAADTGGDTADAIGLGVWYLEEHIIERANRG